MMKGSFGAGIALALLAATPLAAQSTPSARPVTVGVQVGASLPVLDFGDDADLGPAAGLTLALRPTGWPVALRAEATYQRWGGPTLTFGGDVAPVDQDYADVALTGSLLVGPAHGRPVAPYLLLGGGAHRFATTSETEGNRRTGHETGPGAHLGAGVRFPLLGRAAHVEARWTVLHVNDVTLHVLPLVVGVDF
jgi:hypothetical protein